MRFSTGGALLLFVALIAAVDQSVARKAPRSSASSRRSQSVSSRSQQSASRSRRPPVSRRREIEEDDEDSYDMGYEEDPLDDEDDYDEDEMDVESEEESEEEEEYRAPRKPKGKSKRPSSRKPAPRRSSSRFYDDDDEEDYVPQRQPNRRPPAGRGRGRGRGRGGPRHGGRVVSYRRPKPSAFTRGFNTLKNSMPDPGSVKDAAMKSLSVARETTSGLSANLYREMKGLTSSELEQVMLKATRPDDAPVKGKHAERLVGVTYQISGRYDIYDAVLRKLWAKMAEKDWRTTIKALYILHRFSADGSPDHAPALKVSFVGFSYSDFIP